MTAPVSASRVTQALRQNPFVTFVVEGEDIPCELRFLLPCDYFNTMFGSGLCEGANNRIEVPDVSVHVFKEFLYYLKTTTFPSLDYNGVKELFSLAHQYQHEALLTLTSRRLTQEISGHLSEILSLACLYENADLKQACIEYAKQNSYEMRSLLSTLIDTEHFSLVEEMLDWPRDALYQMMNYSESGGNPFSNLLIKNQFLLAAKYLNAAKRAGISTHKLIGNPQEAVYQLLGSSMPSKEQNELIVAIARDNSSVLTNAASSRQDPPLHVAVRNGWDETLEQMLSVCSGNVSRCYSQNQTLLSLAISLKKIPAIQALTKHEQSHPFSEEELKRYVQESVETNNPAVVQAVLALPCKGYHGNTPQRIDVRCIELVIQKDNFTILSILWPEFKGSTSEVARLRMQVYEGNRFDLAEILFSNDFDASSEPYPTDSNKSSMPWLHTVAMKGALEWVIFMIERSKDINLPFECYFSEFKKSLSVTPFLLALYSKRPEKIITTFFEYEVDVDAGNTHFCPIHLICNFENVDLLRSFLEYDLKLETTNLQGRNFFHQYFLCKKTLLSYEELEELVNDSSGDCLKIKDHDGYTSLHYALRAERNEEAFILLTKEPSLLWVCDKERKEKKVEQPLRTLEGQLLDTALNFIIKKACDSKHVSLKRSLLLWCAQNYYYSYCIQLVNAKADVTVQEMSGQTLLHLASSAGAHLAVRQLIKMNLFSVDSKDKAGVTALHIAVEREDVDLVNILIENNANHNLFNNAGETALSSALKKLAFERTDNRQKIVDVLENNAYNVQ